MNFWKKATLGATLAASALVTAAPAEAQRYRGYRDHRNNDAAVAIGAGVVGLAIGAAIASDRRDRYYDDGYYYDRPRVVYRERYYRPYRGYYEAPRYRYRDRRWRERRGYGYGYRYGY